MPDPRREYNRVMLAARADFYNRIRPQLLEEFYEAYGRLLASLVRELNRLPRDAELERKAIEEVIKVVRRQVDVLRDDMLEQAERDYETVIEQMRKAHIEALAKASAAGGVAVRGVPWASDARVLAAMSARQAAFGGSAGFKTLINRNITALGPIIDGYLRASSVGAFTPGETINHIAGVMGQADPLLADAIREALGGNVGRAFRRAVKKTLDGPDELLALRRLFYEARRIVVTETNNAHFEADRAYAEQSPAIDLVKWEVSTRHAALPSSPDICDVLKEGNFHDFGPGLYHPARVPVHPHPHCACWLKKTYRDPKDWNDPKRPLPDITPRSVSLEAVEEALRKGARGNPRARAVTPGLVRQVRRQALPVVTLDAYTKLPGWTGQAESIELFTLPGADLKNLRPEDFTPERRALHNRIINEWFDGYSPVEGQATFTMMGGGPAAGKGTLINTGQIEINGRVLRLDADNRRRSLSHNLISVDTDELKRVLPEWDSVSSDVRAAFFHEESSYLSKQILRKGVNENYDIFFDGTGDGHFSKIAGKVAGYRAQGHRIVAHYATISIEEALRRNWDRYLHTLRLVPPDYVVDVHKTISSWFSQAIQENLFDSVRLWDTTVRGGARLIADGANILDPEGWAAFLRKATYPG